MDWRCTGSATCTFTITGTTSVAASFSSTPMLTVSDTGNASGTVTSSPAGIQCGTTCSYSFAYGTQVTLTATTQPGTVFGGWGGACTDVGSCVVTVDNSTTVTTNFNQMPINHIIFLAQEDRSFDHYFGALRQYWAQNGYPDQAFDGLPQFNPPGNAPPPTNPGCNPANPFQPPGPGSTFQDCVFDTASPVTSFHLQTMCVENPSPSWNESHVAWDYNDPTGLQPAALNGFVWNAGHDSRNEYYFGNILQYDVDGGRTMGYYNGNDLNYYYFMASNFATSDRWFNPVMSRTNPNREYLIGGTSWGYAYPNGTNANDMAEIPTPIIFQELQAAGITWKVYVYPNPQPAQYGTLTCAANDTRPECLYHVTYLQNFTYGQTILNQYPQNIVPIAQFYTDAQNGTLPQVAQIEPASAIGLDEHAADYDTSLACCSVQAGAAYVEGLIAAVMGTSSAPGPSWKDSVFILTYDEFGGFYDHVSPQPAALPGDFAQPVDLFQGPPPNGPDICVSQTGPTCSFDYTGYRVPLIVVSPFTKKNYVSHTVADTTAILKLIETRFGLAPLSGRDAAQIDMTEFFDFSNPSWMIPPVPPAQNTTGACYLNRLP
jgi:phospholipase C